MTKPSAPIGVIPADLVEATWEEVAVMPEESALLEMNRVSNAQPALLAFVFADTENLSHEAHELAVYMFFVILRVFEKHFGRKLGKVDIKTVQRVQKEVGETMDGLGEADEQALQRVALAKSEKQPFVMRYVVESLFEPDEEIELTEEDQGALFLTMKILTDALNSAVRN